VPQAENVVTHIVARIVWAHGESEAVLDEETVHKGTRAEVLAIALIGAKIVTGDANLADARHGRLCSKQSIALSALNVHLQKCNVRNSFLEAEIVRRSGLHDRAR